MLRWRHHRHVPRGGGEREGRKRWLDFVTCGDHRWRAGFLEREGVS